MFGRATITLGIGPHSSCDSPTGYGMQNINDIRKFEFTNRVVNTWNSLPNCDASVNTTKAFKTRLDRPKFWHNQDIISNSRA